MVRFIEDPMDKLTLLLTAEIPVANIVSEDDDDVGLRGGGGGNQSGG
jgi:hypothetical protein